MMYMYFHFFENKIDRKHNDRIYFELFLWLSAVNDLCRMSTSNFSLYTFLLSLSHSFILTCTYPCPGVFSLTVGYFEGIYMSVGGSNEYDQAFSIETPSMGWWGEVCAYSFQSNPLYWHSVLGLEENWHWLSHNG